MTIYEILLLACKTAQESRKPQQNRKMSAQGKHRISTVGQDTQVRITGQHLLDRKFS
jgi:hypothetical protein